MTRVRTGLGTLALAAFAVLQGIAQVASPGAGGVKMAAVKYDFDPNVVRAKKGQLIVDPE